MALFPVRLDKAVMEIEDGWPADIKRTRHVGDLTQWKDHDAYQQAFARHLPHPPARHLLPARQPDVQTISIRDGL